MCVCVFFSMSTTCNFMSNHIFDKISSHMLLYPNQQYTINSELNIHILQNNMVRYRFKLCIKYMLCNNLS